MFFVQPLGLFLDVISLLFVAWRPNPTICYFFFLLFSAFIRTLAAVEFPPESVYPQSMRDLGVESWLAKRKCAVLNLPTGSICTPP